MKLLILEKYEVIRQGLVLMLSKEEEFELIVETANVEEAMKNLRMQEIDIAIIDLSVDQRDERLKLVEKARREGIATKFLIFTSLIRDEDIKKARAIGIEGCLRQDATKEDICYAIKQIARGNSFYMNGLKSKEKEIPYQKIKLLLTDREYEIFKILGKGVTNTQIGEMLFITEATVKKHISSILAKLEMSHRTEAALYAAKLWRRKED